MEDAKPIEDAIRALEARINETSELTKKSKLEDEMQDLQRKLKKTIIQSSNHHKQSGTHDDAIMIDTEDNKYAPIFKPKDKDKQPISSAKGIKSIKSSITSKTNKRHSKSALPTVNRLTSNTKLNPKTSMRKCNILVVPPPPNPPNATNNPQMRNKQQSSLQNHKDKQTKDTSAPPATIVNPVHGTATNNPSLPTQTKSTSDSSTKSISYSDKVKNIKYNKHTIRLHLSVPGFQTPKETRSIGILKAVTKLINDLQVVEHTAQLLPWDAKLDQSHPFINSTNVTKLRAAEANKYLQTGLSKNQCFINTRTHYRQAVRITTSLTLNQFIDTWNSTKREVDGMFGVSPSETQFHHQHALVGICMGSSQKKDISCLLDKLRDEVQLPTLDASWQSVLVGNQTSQLWKEATKKAESEQKNSQHEINIKARKFDWAPTCLSLYAPTEFEAKKVRAILIQKYSKNVTDGVFPSWPDGSRMKFLPMSNRPLSNRSTLKVVPRIRFHSYLKAKELTLDIPDVNPWTTIPGSPVSLGEYLHSLVDTNGLPIFRHVTKKWTPNPKEDSWQVTCYGTKYKLAVEKLHTLPEDLRSLYGNEAATYVSISPLRAPIDTSDIDAFYDSLQDDDKQEFILDPSYTDVFARSEMEAMQITDNDSTYAMSETTKTQSHNPPRDYQSDSSIESASISTFTTTRSVTFDESVASQPNLTPDELRLRTLSKYQITQERYSELQEAYPHWYEEVAACHNKEINRVKAFIKLLKTLKIELRPTEGGLGTYNE